MKTIGYRDRMDPSGAIKFYKGSPKQHHHDRIAEAFQALRGLGNVNIVLLQGRKYRRIGQRDL